MTAPRVVVLDTRDCGDKGAVLAAFARDLAFPAYFGHNWDALADCLSDFVTGDEVRLVVWTGASEIPPDVAETAMQIVREAFTDSRSADIVIVDPPNGEESLMASREEIASIVDHTVLKPETTRAELAAHCAEAAELGVFSVCVSPSFLPLPEGSLPDSIAVCTVVGFPSGKHRSEIKASEAARAIADGADEIDMVIDVGAAVAGEWDAVAADVRAVRAATRGTLLKVIIESAALTDDQIVRVCQICETEGADFVKTSTGFHPSGGASEHAVALMRETVGDRLGVKASGGIRTNEAAQAMIAAGASRLGLSGTRAVLDGAEATGDY